MIPCRYLFGISSTDFSLPVHVVLVLFLRMAILPYLAQAIPLILGAIGGPLLKPLTWVPLALYAVLLEVSLRSFWHSVMDDD